MYYENLSHKTIQSLHMLSFRKNFLITACIFRSLFVLIKLQEATDGTIKGIIVVWCFMIFANNSAVGTQCPMHIIEMVKI